jgi:hypothetical protein
MSFFFFFFFSSSLSSFPIEDPSFALQSSVIKRRMLLAFFHPAISLPSTVL